jgi:hypothetical protein
MEEIRRIQNSCIRLIGRKPSEIEIEEMINILSSCAKISDKKCMCYNLDTFYKSSGKCPIHSVNRF